MKLHPPRRRHVDRGLAWGWKLRSVAAVAAVWIPKVARLMPANERNRAVAVEGRGAAAFAEHEHLQREPAYGNMAELGFGVLEAFGIEPVGKILLDEKLGFHVAFGRSEHFGGIVGPDDFSSPEEVIHLDRIYIPATQPRIIIKSLILQYEDNRGEIIMENSRYLLF